MRRSEQRLVILNYHRATGDHFRCHLLYLRRHYRILHLEVALEELYTKRKDREHKTDRRMPLVLTFDDGYYDNYMHGYALARELQVPFTIFLNSGYVESGARFWWLEAKRLVSRAQVNEIIIEGRTYHLQQQEEQEALARLIDTRLRQASSVAEREKFLASITEVMKVPSSLNAEERAMLPLSWAEVQEMDGSGWVSFGAHTINHPVLLYLTNLTEVQREVTECRVILEQRLNHSVRTFAYPIGQLQHITQDVLQAVRDAGYTWALTTVYGFNTPRSDPYLLHRIEVDTVQHWLVVAAATTGLWGFFSRLRWVPAIRHYLENPLRH
jgi:peptidoglycan/xylan/chitin deacetylase (PgdA/CDA1 family)